MNSEESLRLEKLALLIGLITGQINELLNQTNSNNLLREQIYKSLLDINKMSSIQMHELYYKEKK
jgi:hypothetical protein